MKKFKLSGKKLYYTFCRKYVHRIVAELFIPNPDNKPEIDHIDTNKINNRVDNLRWVTRKENLNNEITLKHFSVSNKNKGFTKGKGRKCLKGKHRVYDKNGKYHYE